MTTDPQELERLSKAADQEDDDVRYYGGPTSTHRPARDAYHAALVQLHRTGQLVPAQPSGDVVEAVALAILNSDRGMRGLDPLESRENVPDSDGYVTNATAAITAYEAVSGVAKMREDVDRDEAFCDIVWSALKGDHNDLRRQQIILRAFRAALGEKL